MQYILNSKEAKAIDSYTIDKIGIPSLVLQERAAKSVADVITERMDGKKRVAVICGTGNNGADGLAIARLLLEQSIKVTVFVIGEESFTTPEWKTQHEILQHLGISFGKVTDFAEYDVIVDAIFGIGLTRPVSGEYAAVIEEINKATWALKVAVDIASGLSASNGKILGVAVAADITVTFGSRKLGQLLYQGPKTSGEVLVRFIGFPEKSYEAVNPGVITFEKKDLKELPKRPAEGHKGTFGRVLIIAGSKNMCGAAYLSAKAAYRTGAGLVRIFTPEENRQILQTSLPEAVLTTYDSEHFSIPLLEEVCEMADVVVVGPGIGRDSYVRSMVNYLLQYITVPMVIDADALNCIAQDPHMLDLLKENHILTPHLGELSRILHRPVSLISESLLETAQYFGRNTKAVCVCKDSHTVVTRPEGSFYLNISGNSGMATAGSGDVLTGVIAGLLAEGQQVFQAATRGVYIHGLAGDTMAEVLGKRSLMATDIIEGIGKVLG